MKNLNILVDCHVFDQSFQGTTSYITGLYREMIKDRSKTFYFVSHRYDLETIFGSPSNVIYLRYESKNKFYRLLIELPRMIRKHSIDYAHFQYVVPPIKSCKYIVTVHDVLFLDYPNYFPWSYRISKKVLYKLSAKKSDIVLTVSEYSRKQIEKHFGIEKISITPNAVDAAFFEPYDKQQITAEVRNKFGIADYFLFVSRWEPRKNHDMLLKVFVENDYYKAYNLVFVGADAIPNPKYDAYYEALPNAVKAKIIKFGKVNFDELLALNRGAALSAYPSIAEGFGIPPLESVAAQVPTVCSRTTAMSDFDFIGNCLFDPFDSDDFHAKIQTALRDTELEAKKRKILSKYNWPESANQLQQAIAQNEIAGAN